MHSAYAPANAGRRTKKARAARSFPLLSKSKERARAERQAPRGRANIIIYIIIYDIRYAMQKIIYANKIRAAICGRNAPLKRGTARQSDAAWRNPPSTRAGGAAPAVRRQSDAGYVRGNNKQLVAAGGEQLRRAGIRRKSSADADRAIAPVFRDGKEHADEQGRLPAVARARR